MTIGFLVWLVLAADGDRPFAAVPPVQWREADALEATLREVRRLKDGGLIARARAWGELGLERTACRGLVYLRGLEGAREVGLVWQDDVAGREWARPALARVLIEAHRRWGERHRGQAIGVGDVAQAGCGQIDPGTLTRWVEGPAAVALEEETRPVAGVPTARSVVAAAGAGRARRRLVERRVVARDGDGLLFVHLRRYDEVARAAGAREIERKVRAIQDAGELVFEEAGPDARGAMQWRQRWVDATHFRQAIVVVGARRQPFRIEDAVDVGLAPWAPARPGEARGERRFVRADVHAAGVAEWSAWRLIEEGSHVTHMAGRDADLSYPMKRPARRFETDPDGIDLAATWDWFVTLIATSESLGTPIDRIVVGGRVLPRLLAAIPGARASRLVRDKILKVVPNHDDHHHVRLAVPTPAADAEAMAALGGADGSDQAILGR